jgi:Protein of unknown function (DUF1153)
MATRARVGCRILFGCAGIRQSSVTLPQGPAPPRHGSVWRSVHAYRPSTARNKREAFESGLVAIYCFDHVGSRSGMSVPDARSIHRFWHPGTVAPGKSNPELPAAATKRWSSRRKAAVVIAVRTGMIARAEACARYALSEEELAAWEIAFQRSGIPGLRSGIRSSYASPAKHDPAETLSHGLG